MAVKNLILKLGLKGVRGTQSGLGAIDSSVKGITKSVLKAGATFFAAKGIIEGVKTTIAVSSQLQAVKSGFDNLSQGIGGSADTLRKLQDATDGTVDNIELMTQANNAMLLGIFENNDQMAEMFDVAQRLGAALGKDTAFGVESLVTGMGRQSKLMLDNLGIIVDTTAAYKTFAAELGVNVKQLTESQKKQAFNNAALAEAKRLVDDLGEETIDSSMIFEQFAKATDDLQISIGEKLTPIVAGLTKAFTDLITLDPSEEAKKERFEFENLLGVLTDVNTSTSSRTLAIQQLKKEYSGYLGDLDIEKASIEDINKLQTDQVALMEQRIQSMLFAEQLEEVQTKLKKEQLELFELERNGLEAVTSSYGTGITVTDNSKQAQAEASRERIEQLQQELDSILQLQSEFIKSQQIQNKGAEDSKKNDDKKKKGTQANIDKTKELGLIGQIFSKESAQVAIDGASSGAKANLIEKIMKAIPFPFNLAVSAGAGKFIDEIFAKNDIKKAQYGADFVTSGPQMMMVGEGSGPERVQVTPLSDPNIDGPAGQSVTVNVQGSVIGTEEFTESTLIPQIKEGLRLGERI